MKDIKDLNVVIATHEFATGPAQNLKEFCLANKLNNFLFIGHPLIYQEEQKGSNYNLYSSGTLIYEKVMKNKKRPELINYFVHFLFNIYFVLSSKQKWDLFVGSDSLNALAGLFLRSLGKVDKVVFYCIDYIPNRFQNKILTKLYHLIDIFCVKHCDKTWNLSPRMMEGREIYSRLSEKYRSKQVLVPEGVWFDRIKRLHFDKINQTHAVFLGHLDKRLGVQEVIKSIPHIIKKIPNFKFVIIGKGPYSEELKKLAEQLKVENHIVFTGFVKDHRDVENIIARCGVGIATYETSKDSFSFFADPSKTKIYMACGLPVIMTDLFYNAKEIEDAGAGIIVDYDSRKITERIIYLMSDKKVLERYRQRAISYIKNYNWNIIFNSNIQNLYKVYHGK